MLVLNMYRLIIYFPALFLTCLCSTELFIQKSVKPNIFQPPIPHRPFVAVWNADTGNCLSSYNVTVNLSYFDIVHNPDQKEFGDFMVIFYKPMLGYYPYFQDDDTPVNGGIPQLGNLTSHLMKSKQDIEKYIPNNSYQGLAVIDWESWRPLWVHNGWGKDKVYQTASLDKVRQDHPDWTDDQVAIRAKEEFEHAAKAYFLETLKLAVQMRPNAKWGYYLYPQCFNYDKTGADLTCHNSTQQDNNELEWLFSVSSSLYPSTYLGLWFKNKSCAIDYTANRIYEAKRVDDNRPSKVGIPIYSYNNINYKKVSEYLILQDVIDSSGVAAFLGASGVVIWGHHTSSSRKRCEETKTYVETILGPYLKLASDSAAECSSEVCNSKGRCVFSFADFPTSTNHRLYLLELFLKLSFPNMKHYNIVCQCYVGYSGESCQYD